MGVFNTWLYIDTSELSGTIGMMERKLSREEFNALMYRTLKEVGNRAKTPIKKAVADEYEVTQHWVASAMGNPRMSVGDGIQCIIPIDGTRGTIGREFSASGGRLDRRSKRAKRALTMKAHIVKGQTSILPEKMSHQGGNPPFMVNGIGMTRKTPARYPLARVVGLAVPQMPINRARDEVQQKIIELLEKRVIHNLEHMFG